MEFDLVQFCNNLPEDLGEGFALIGRMATDDEGEQTLRIRLPENEEEYVICTLEPESKLLSFTSYFGLPRYLVDHAKLSRSIMALHSETAMAVILSWYDNSEDEHVMLVVSYRFPADDGEWFPAYASRAMRMFCKQAVRSYLDVLYDLTGSVH